MERMERITETYHNLYWTRIIRTRGNRGQEFERVLVGPDLIESYNELDDLSALISLGHRIHFDP